MIEDNTSVMFLVVLERDGDISLRKGRTQEFQSVEVHSTDYQVSRTHASEEGTTRSSIEKR